jgi:hypothetical protein
MYASYSDLQIKKSTMQYIAGAVHRPAIVQTNTVRGSAHPVRVKFMTCRAESTSRGLWREKATRCYTMVY